MSKEKLAGSLEKKTLTLKEKVSLLDYRKGNKIGCRKLAEIFKIGKTAAANIVKHEVEIRKQYDEFCEKDKKRIRFGKYKQINDILFNWYQKCCASNFYPSGIFLKEEALEIKKRLENPDIESFSASDGWLTKWKSNYHLKDRKVCGEAGDVSGETVTSWMERIGELVKGYAPEDIWNMDESGVFLRPSQKEACF